MPLLLLCTSFQSEQKLGWISFIVQPLSLESDQEIRFLYRALATSDNQQFLLRIYLRNDKYPNRILVFQNSIFVSKGDTQDISRLFVLDHTLVDNSMNELTFSCVSNGIEEQVIVKAALRFPSPFYPSEEQVSLTTPYNYYELRDGVLSRKRDMFVFNGFSNIVDDDYYYYLDLSGLSIFSSNAFTYSKVSLLIEESENLYRLFPESVPSGFRKLPVQIVARDLNNYDIRLAENLYVDPDTLLMSPKMREGFIATSKFYFPKDYYDTEHDVRFKLLIDGCGYNEIDIIYDFYYYSHLKLIGDCRDSQYCIGVTSTEDEGVLTDWEETRP